MAMPEMEAVKDAALKYDKPTLGRMAQLGQISATLAVMAGMMRDRIVQSEMKPPTKTVAQEVLPADSMGMEGFSDPTAAQQPVMRRAGGLTVYLFVTICTRWLAVGLLRSKIGV
jgi:hypothetical protein